MTLNARTCLPSALGADELAAWDRLAASHAQLASPFLSATYARAVEAAGAPARVCVLREGEQAVAFFPYQRAPGLAGWLDGAIPVGAGMTDYFGLIADPALRIDSARLLALAGLNHVEFSHLDDSQLAYGLAGEQPRTGLRIRLDTQADNPLAALLAEQRKYRNDSERRARQIEKEVGALRFVFDVEEGRAQVLDSLIAHKRAQYDRTGAADAMAEPWKLRLLHALCAVRHPGCRAVLSTLHAGEQWVAMHFGLAGNGILQYWLPVYNPAMARYAPGRLLIHRVIEESRAAAIGVIDRGEGDTPAKRELANEEHQFLRGVWHNGSLASSLTRALHSIQWRLAA